MCLLVALVNGDIRLYGADKNLLHTLKTMEPIAALRFGPYAREDGALAVISTSGTCVYAGSSREPVNNILFFLDCGGCGSPSS